MDLDMPLFAKLGMGYSKYDGLLSHFTSGDPSIVLVDIPTLELLMTGEDRCRAALCITPGPAPSANRVTQANPDPQAGTHRNDHQDIHPSHDNEYPPKRDIKCGIMP